jgi:hypothetical protein
MGRDATLPAQVVRRESSQAAGVEPGPRESSKTYRYRDVEKRRAYMRDLMRRKRARKAAS